jgi:hypothetical protein
MFTLPHCCPEQERAEALDYLRQGTQKVLTQLLHDLKSSSSSSSSSNAVLPTKLASSSSTATACSISATTSSSDNGRGSGATAVEGVLQAAHSNGSAMSNTAACATASGNTARQNQGTLTSSNSVYN